MIAFVKGRLAALRHVTVDNPLFFYQLRRFSVYTWLNLAALFALALVIYCTAARSAHYWEARSWITIFSVAGQEEISPNTMYRDEDYLMGLEASTRFSSFSRFSEGAYYFGQLGGISLLFIVLVLGAYKILHFQDKHSLEHPHSLHIRMLPLSRRQVQFALIDLRFFTVSACILCSSLLLLLPALDNLFPPIFEYSYFPCRFFLYEFELWVFLFAIYRTKQFQQPYGKRIWENPMLFSWLFASAIVIFVPLVCCRPVAAFWGDLPDYVRFELIQSCIHLALFMLLISCWMLKGRLLKQQVAE